MIRVGFIEPGGGGTGGSNYMKNLLNAVTMAGGDVAPVLIVPPDMPDTALAAFPRVETIRTKLANETGLGWKLRRVLMRLTGSDFVMDQFLRRNRIAALSHSCRLGKRARTPTLCWIPDFQHRRMPEFFQPQELRQRDGLFLRMCETCTTIIVSSHDAQNDLARFAPSAVAKSRVLQFVSGLCDVERQENLTELRARYGFVGPYFFLPNQFWAHKNHRLVVDALAILKARGIPLLVLCTGHTEDRRQPGYFAELMAHVKAKGVEEEFRVLGLVPYGDLSSLMRHALAVVNPSLFEGWSTSVEEAKSLGKTVILSDIPVHREQAPERGHYFRPDGPEELADALLRVAGNWNAEEELSEQEKAQAALPDRFSSFARAYHAIIHDTLEKCP